ncbi:HD domain-containing protein [Enterobacter ludwigii]|jgi:(p)ppGpp synthase/HD superfamily hydrolase|uniref:HD domain-containing protein n=1 Tax=Enterobacter ludwigii TaxID=299767 RepID=A0AAX3L5J5_9ENTR|nr:HD domain-containing protein [Enterobacter ludwigii]MBX8912924.1 bifunctional (p)ppGpp synthetase/guanosine-3',5'-bis(diphosphate) 3'-pyrophosphohydrolase [Enterobacter ludwigii]WCE11540.1 HD domain-containing protein [Enterobacter ludwigii]
MSNLVVEAMIFAMQIHKDQKRKFTGNPYFNHLSEVAGIVGSVERKSDIVQAVAWLHDSIEDQGISPNEIETRFGKHVRIGVEALSDLETGTREKRKRLSRERLAKQPGWIQNIKVADIISNCSSVLMHDPSFATVYLAEKRLLLEVLTKASPELLSVAWLMVNANPFERSANVPANSTGSDLR